MSMRIRPQPFLIGVLVPLWGCASLDARPAFERVQSMSSERGIPELTWNRDEAARQAVAERVRTLLESELTPESAVQVALLRNRALQATLAELGIAQAELVQAGLLRNPVLSAAVRFGVGSSEVGADLSLVQDFMDALQIPLRRRVAQARLEATTLTVGAEVFALAVDVKDAFFEAQGAQQMIELKAQISEATQVAAELASRQHTAGNLNDLDLVNEQALREEARLALAEAEVQAAERREELTALLGLWGGETRWSMAPRLPAVPTESPRPEGLESLAVSRRLDLAASQWNLAVAGSSVELARFFGLVPEADAGVAAEKDFEQGTWSVGPSLELPVPLFDQSQARLAAARVRQRQAEDQFAALAVRIRSEVRRAWTRLDAARSRVRFMEDAVLPLRERIVEQTQLRYNAMQIGVYELLQAKRGQIDAGRDYVESLRAFWRSDVALERALGTELPHPSHPGGRP